MNSLEKPLEASIRTFASLEASRTILVDLRSKKVWLARANCQFLQRWIKTFSEIGAGILRTGSVAQLTMSVNSTVQATLAMYEAWWVLIHFRSHMLASQLNSSLVTTRLVPTLIISNASLPRNVTNTDSPITDVSVSFASIKTAQLLNSSNQQKF